MSVPTITRYVDVLVDLLLVRRLAPMLANVGKRLVKSPKIYVRDSGLVHALLGIEDHQQLLGHPVVGGSWEGFVIETLLAVAPNRTTASYYRTAAGAEIDLVIEFPRRGTWAVEIKRSLSPVVTKGFHLACGDNAPKRRFVVYPGRERYPMSPELEAIGLREMAELVAGG